MIVASPTHLRSLLQESGRQADFYMRKHDGDVAEFWAELESLAFRARTSGQSLVIEIRECLKTPIIKLGEQHQQLRKPLED